MGKRYLGGVIRILMIDLGIILGSAWLGISLNRSFVARPQGSFFTYSEGKGGLELKALSAEEAKATTQIWGHVPRSEVKAIVASKSMVLLDGRSEKGYEPGTFPAPIR